MIKKIFSYILSASLLFSSEQNIFASDPKSLYNSKKSTIFSSINFKNALKWSGMILTIGMLSVGIKKGLEKVFTSQTNIDYLLSELKKEKFSITEQQVSEVIMRSFIQGLTYLEGTSRYPEEEKTKKTLNDLVETIILLKAYDKLNSVFKLDIKEDRKKPELLIVSKTKGNGIVQEITNLNKNPNNIEPIREAENYMKSIKDKFDKLTKKEISKKMSELPNHGSQSTENLLVPLMILSTPTEKLKNLIIQNNHFVELH